MVLTPERLELAAKVINLAEDGYNVHRNSLLGRMAGGPGVDHIYHIHKEFYAASYVELTLSLQPLPPVSEKGRARTTTGATARTGTRCQHSAGGRSASSLRAARRLS